MAYEQGLLTQKRVTRIQRWALSYHLNVMDEKQFNERDDLVKLLTKLINPDLYDAVFKAKELGGDGSGDDVVSVDEIDTDEMQEFLKSLQKPQFISAGPTGEDGWA